MKHLLLTLFTLLAISVQASPVTDMLERIDKGASKKFKFELLKNDGKASSTNKGRRSSSAAITGLMWPSA